MLYSYESNTMMLLNRLAGSFLLLFILKQAKMIVVEYDSDPMK